MNRKENIKQLLEKYLEGQTSLKEEKQLRYYFLFEEVDQEFVSYKALFQFFENEKQLEFTQVPELSKSENKKSKVLFFQYWKIAVAAVLIIGLGISWYSTNQNEAVQSLSHEEVLVAQRYLTLSLGTLDKTYSKSANLLYNAQRIDKNTRQIQKMGKMYDSNMQSLQPMKYIDQSLEKLENIKSIQKSRIKLVM